MAIISSRRRGKYCQPDFRAKMGTICRLCLQIEWHRSRRRETGGVLAPKKKFVDTGQARREILFVQEGKGVQHPFTRDILPKIVRGRAIPLCTASAPKPETADFTISLYIRLSDKVKSRVNSGSLPEKCSRCRTAQSSVYSLRTWQARPLC